MAIPNDVELLYNDSNEDGDGDYSFIPKEEHSEHIGDYFVVAWEDSDNKHHEGVWYAHDKTSEKETMKEIAEDRDNVNIRIARRFRGITPN